MAVFLFKLYRYVGSILSNWIYAWLGRLQMHLVGIHFEKGVRFSGIPYFVVAREGEAKIGANSVFRSKATSNLIGINRRCIISVHENANLSIGANCGFSGTVIGCFVQITIDENVRCGANTLITDSDWHSDDLRSGAPRPVHICRNVWLGEGVKVLKGVTIGENSIIGAGSIVTKDVPANVVAAGNPCKVLKDLTFEKG